MSAVTSSGGSPSFVCRLAVIDCTFNKIALRVSQVALGTIGLLGILLLGLSFNNSIQDKWRTYCIGASCIGFSILGLIGSCVCVEASPSESIFSYLNTEISVNRSNYRLRESIINGLIHELYEISAQGDPHPCTLDRLQGPIQP